MVRHKDLLQLPHGPDILTDGHRLMSGLETIVPLLHYYFKKVLLLRPLRHPRCVLSERALPSLRIQAKRSGSIKQDTTLRASGCHRSAFPRWSSSHRISGS